MCAWRRCNVDHCLLACVGGVQRCAVALASSVFFLNFKLQRKDARPLAPFMVGWACLDTTRTGGAHELTERSQHRQQHSQQLDPEAPLLPSCACPREQGVTTVLCFWWTDVSHSLLVSVQQCEMSVFEWVDEPEAESALSNLSINNTQWFAIQCPLLLLLLHVPGLCGLLSAQRYNLRASYAGYSSGTRGPKSSSLPPALATSLTSRTLPPACTRTRTRTTAHAHDQRDSSRAVAGGAGLC